jgi:hypothetical protein
MIATNKPVGRTVLPSARAAGAFRDTGADGKTVRPTATTHSPSVSAGANMRGQL